MASLLACAENTSALDLVWFHLAALKARSIYEHALIHAFIATRVNNHRWSLSALRLLLETADRARLRTAGDPLPGPGPFTVYRGVAGRGAARRVRGLSWTADRDRAQWFARRFWAASPDQYSDPAVFRVKVDAADVLAYCNDRQEQEFIVLLPSTAKPKRIRETVLSGVE